MNDQIPAVVHASVPLLAAGSAGGSPLSDRVAASSAVPAGGNRRRRRSGAGCGHHLPARPLAAGDLRQKSVRSQKAQFPSRRPNTDAH